MDVLLVAAKKKIVQSYVDVLEKAGLKPVIMDVDPFALETMYEFNYENENGDVVILLNIGASMTNINVLKGGSSIFTRDISMGGQHLTESIQEKLGVTFDEAERIKLEASNSDVQHPDSRLVNPLDYAEPLFAEIERSIDYFRSTHGGEYIKEVILSGGSSKINGITDALNQRLNIDTQIVRPLQNIDYHNKFDAATMEDIGPVAALGIGLALRRMDDR
jgi:type IV pilus assembly protein PilM